MAISALKLAALVGALLWTAALPTYALWEKVNPQSSLSATIFDLAHSDNIWVAVGDRGLIALRNGDSWTELQPVANSPLRSVANIGSHFVAVGDNGLILASTEGHPDKWSVRASHTSKKLIDIQKLDSTWYILGEQGLILSSLDGLEWTTLRQADDDGPDFTCISRFGGQFVGLTDYQQNAWRSADGISWTVNPASTQVNFPRGLRVLNGHLIAWGSYGGIARSSDGYTWVKTPPHPATSSTRITDMIYADGRYFLTVSNTFLDADLPIYSSTDLATWSATDGTARHCISTDGTSFLAAKGAEIVTSPDGLNWKTTKGHLSYPVIFSQGQFRGVDRNFLYSSPDGLTWTETRLPEGISGLGIYEANGHYLLQRNGKVCVSTDLQTWQTAASPYGTLGSDFLYAFGRYFAVVTESLVTSIYTSTDALNWTSFSAGVSVAFGNGRLVAVNSYSNVFQLRVSTNGTSYTAYSISGQPGATSITYGNGLFVAVSGWSGYRVRTSSDGVTWTIQTTPEISGELSEISFQNGRFIARGKGAIITSTDGITWQDVSYAAWDKGYKPPYSIVHGNDVWMLTGGFPLRSVDFPNWDLLTDPFDHTFIQVRYLQGAFWAVSRTTDNITTGSLWRSSNGLDWTLVKRLPFVPADVAVSPSMRVIVADDGFGQVAVSDDLHTWQITDAGLGRVRTLIYHAGAFYAGIQGGLRRSTDGLVWSPVDGLPNFDCTAIYSSPLGVTAAGSTGYPTRLFHSVDGVTWVTYTTSTSQNLNTISYQAPNLIVSGGSGYFLKSTDGLTWTVTASAYQGTLRKSIPASSESLVLSGGLVYRSSFESPVTLYPENCSGYITSIAHGNGVAVAVGNNSGIYRKTNLAPPSPPTALTVTDVGDRYVTLHWQNEIIEPAAVVLEYREAGSSTWLRFGNLHPPRPNTLKISNLLPSTTYDFRIRNVAAGSFSEPGEMVGPLPVTITPIQEWRRTYFGSQHNIGLGANDEDPDKDGSTNLLEYAFGTNPLVANPQDMPVTTAPHLGSGGYTTFTMAFWCDGFNTDITYIVETSPDLVRWWVKGTSIGGQHFEESDMRDSFDRYLPETHRRQVRASVTSLDRRFFRVRIHTND